MMAVVGWRGSGGGSPGETSWEGAALCGALERRGSSGASAADPAGWGMRAAPRWAGGCCSWSGAGGAGGSAALSAALSAASCKV